MRRLAKIFAALVLVTGATLGLGASSADAIPSASFTCRYIATTEITHAGTEQVLFAKYEVLTSTYAQARCLYSWQSANVTLVCGFYARYYSNGAIAGPYSLNCS